MPATESKAKPGKMPLEAGEGQVELFGHVGLCRHVVVLLLPSGQRRPEAIGEVGQAEQPKRAALLDRMHDQLQRPLERADFVEAACRFEAAQGQGETASGVPQGLKEDRALSVVHPLSPQLNRAHVAIVQRDLDEGPWRGSNASLLATDERQGVVVPPSRKSRSGPEDVDAACAARHSQGAGEPTKAGGAHLARGTWFSALGAREPTFGHDDTVDGASGIFRPLSSRSFCLPSLVSNQA